MTLFPALREALKGKVAPKPTSATLTCVTLKFEYPSAVRFKCSLCALCCGDTEKKARNILLLKSEAEQIARETQRKVAEFAEPALGFEPYHYRMKKTAEGKCLFLADCRCSIYGYRPLVCRFYPFELRNAGNDKFVFVHTGECPGIGKGPIIRKKFFVELFAFFIEKMKENTSK
ncbi:MAG: YkgJ family cysteine cluster protein [Candidatus Bathyarchaeia archaeon]